MQPSCNDTDHLLHSLSARPDAATRGFGREVVDQMLLRACVDISSPFWRLFHPLLRRGDVDEVDRRRYRVCAPTLRWHETAGCATWIGARIPGAWGAFCKASDGKAQWESGTAQGPARWRLNADRDTCAVIARRLDIGFSQDGVEQFWLRLPTIASVLAALPMAPPPSSEIAGRGVGVYPHGGHGREPITHWLNLRPGDATRALPPRDEVIHMGRWYTRCAAIGASTEYNASTWTLSVPVWPTASLPTIPERLLTLETGGAETQASRLCFSPVAPSSAREALRVLAVHPNDRVAGRL